jgi:hypothetical protein
VPDLGYNVPMSESPEFVSYDWMPAPPDPTAAVKLTLTGPWEPADGVRALVSKMLPVAPLEKARATIDFEAWKPWLPAGAPSRLEGEIRRGGSLKDWNCFPPEWQHYFEAAIAEKNLYTLEYLLRSAHANAAPWTGETEVPIR